MLYALLFHKVVQVHRTAVGMGGVGKTSDGPWVDIPLELQDRGLPPRLPTLGPLESMQMMMKIQDFMARAAQDPSLLLSRRGWREVFAYDYYDPWSELFEWWGMYSEYIHGIGSGLTAGNNKTETNYHTATVESLVEQAQEYKDSELFNTLAGLFCNAFAEGIEANHNDYGWYQKLRDSNSDAAYYEFLAQSGVKSRHGSSSITSTSSSTSSEHADVAALRASSRLMKPYSLNEPYFGSLKQKHSLNHQVRVDGLAAQATEEQNGSFLPGAVLSQFNKAALLVIRKWVRGKRRHMRTYLSELADAQVARKLQMRRACVEAKIEKYREAYARAMVEWNVKVSSM